MKNTTSIPRHLTNFADHARRLPAEWFADLPESEIDAVLVTRGEIDPADIAEPATPNHLIPHPPCSCSRITGHRPACSYHLDNLTDPARTQPRDLARYLTTADYIRVDELRIARIHASRAK